MAIAESVDALERWAEHFLRLHGYPPARIVRISAPENGDGFILVVGVRGPMTAWLRRDPKGIQPRMAVEPGWPAVPGPGVWADEDDYEDYEPGEGAGTQ